MGWEFAGIYYRAATEKEEEFTGLRLEELIVKIAGMKIGDTIAINRTK